MEDFEGFDIYDAEFKWYDHFIIYLIKKVSR